MNIQEKRDLLAELARSEGLTSVDALIELAATDSISPAICTRCRATTGEMEPDQDRGYCENCGQNTVVSALVLADLI